MYSNKDVKTAVVNSVKKLIANWIIWVKLNDEELKNHAALWCDQLKGYPPEVIIEAADNIIRYEDRYPSLSLFHKYCMKALNERLNALNNMLIKAEGKYEGGTVEEKDWLSIAAGYERLGRGKKSDYVKKRMKACQENIRDGKTDYVPMPDEVKKKIAKIVEKFETK